MNETVVKKLIRQYNNSGSGQTEEQRILNARINNLRRYDAEQIQIYNQNMLNAMGDSVVRITAQDPNLGKYLSQDTEKQYGDEYWLNSNAEEALLKITDGAFAKQIAEELTTEEKQYLIANINDIYTEVKKSGKGKINASQLLLLIKSKFARIAKPVIDLTGDDDLSFGFSQSVRGEPTELGDAEEPELGSFGETLLDLINNSDYITLFDFLNTNRGRGDELTADDLQNIFFPASNVGRRNKLKREEMILIVMKLEILPNVRVRPNTTKGFLVDNIREKIVEMRQAQQMPFQQTPSRRASDASQFSNPPSRPASPQPAGGVVQGSGISFNKRMPFHHKNVIVGRGLEPTEKEPTKKRLESRKYYDKIYIDLDKLSRGILYCKYISHDQPITSLRTQRISKEVRDMIKDIIADKYNIRVFNLLNRSDKRIVRTFADKFNYSLEMGDDEDEELQKQFEVLLGQYEAGNNDEKLKAKLRSYVRIAIKEDLIPYKEALGLLVELS